MAGYPYGLSAGHNVAYNGATGDGTHDDQPAIQRAIAVIKNAGQGTLYFPAGTYRIARKANAPSAPIYFYEKSNVTINFEPNAVLLLDNLNSFGEGDQGHGVYFRGRASNIWLNNVHVKWKTLPSRRSEGDGIRFDGYPSDSRTISNIHLLNPTVERAPQAGIIFMGASDVDIKNATVRNTLADGLHVNASRRVNIDRYESQNTGDDGLALVTYYDPSSTYTYPGTNAGPYSRPSLGSWNNTDSSVNNVHVYGGWANGMRINFANRLRVSNLRVENKDGMGLMMDGTEADGVTYGWSVGASRGVVVQNLTVSGSYRAFTVVHLGGDKFNSPSPFWDFDATINNVTANSNLDVGAWAAGSLEYVANVKVNGVYGTDRNKVAVVNCRNSRINMN